MLVDHLRKEFAARSHKNPQYSLRAFSRSLKIDSSTLSALLRNKRRLSVNMAKKLLDALEIEDPARRQRIFAESFHSAGPAGSTVEPTYQEISLAQFAGICTWEHFAILALLEISLPRPDLASIARALSLSTALTMAALYRLENLGLVSNQFGRWTLTRRNLATPTGIASEPLRRCNRQNIERALESLDNDPLERRDFTGITMAIDKRKLPEAKRRIKEFRRSLAAFLEKNNKNAVYRLNIQLFPLTGEEL